MHEDSGSMSCKLQGRHLDALAGLSLLPPSLQTRARPFLPCSSYLPVQQVTSQVQAELAEELGIKRDEEEDDPKKKRKKKRRGGDG